VVAHQRAQAVVTLALMRSCALAQLCAAEGNAELAPLPPMQATERIDTHSALRLFCSPLPQHCEQLVWSAEAAGAKGGGSACA
jgi:hypothetical protein